MGINRLNTVAVGTLPRGSSPSVFEAAASDKDNALRNVRPFGPQDGTFFHLSPAQLTDTRNWAVTKLNSGSASSTLTVVGADPLADRFDSPRLRLTAEAVAHRGLQARWAHDGTNVIAATAQFSAEADQREIGFKFWIYQGTGAVADSSFIFGLGTPTETSILSAASVRDINDFIGFYKPAGSTINGHLVLGGTGQNVALGTFAASTWTLLECRFTATTAEFWINGVRYDASAANLAYNPLDVALTPIIALTSHTGVQSIVDIKGPSFWSEAA